MKSFIEYAMGRRDNTQPDDSGTFKVGGPYTIRPETGPEIWVYLPEGMSVNDMPDVVRFQGVEYHGRYQSVPSSKGPVTYFRAKLIKPPPGYWPLETLGLK